MTRKDTALLCWEQTPTQDKISTPKASHDSFNGHVRLGSKGFGEKTINIDNFNEPKHQGELL